MKSRCYPKYSTDNGNTWYDATTEGTISGLGASKYVGEFVWLAQIDLDGLRRYSSVSGDTAQRKRRYFRFNKGIKCRLQRYPRADGRSGRRRSIGDVPIYYSVSDSESDLVSIAVLYSVDDRASWNTASVSGDISGVAGDGSSHTVVWNSVNDVPGQDIKKRMAASDRFGLRYR